MIEGHAFTPHDTALLPCSLARSPTPPSLPHSLRPRCTSGTQRRILVFVLFSSSHAKAEKAAQGKKARWVLSTRFPPHKKAQMWIFYIWFSYNLQLKPAPAAQITSKQFFENAHPESTTQ